MKLKMKSLSMVICYGCLALGLAGNPLFAADSSPASEKFTRDSTLMEIDLAKNLLVVGEKYVYLQSTGKKSKKRWLTQFLDVNNSPINPRSLEVPDRVLVEGEVKASGKIIADKVVLMEKKEPFSSTTKSGKKKGNTINKKNGVWTN